MILFNEKGTSSAQTLDSQQKQQELTSIVRLSDFLQQQKICPGYPGESRWYAYDQKIWIYMSHLKK